MAVTTARPIDHLGSIQSSTDWRQGPLAPVMWHQPPLIEVGHFCHPQTAFQLWHLHEGASIIRIVEPPYAITYHPSSGKVEDFIELTTSFIDFHSPQSTLVLELMTSYLDDQPSCTRTLNHYVAQSINLAAGYSFISNIGWINNIDISKFNGPHPKKGTKATGF